MQDVRVASGADVAVGRAGSVGGFAGFAGTSTDQPIAPMATYAAHEALTGPVRAQMLSARKDQPRSEHGDLRSDVPPS